jgi:hypothetical protein
MAESGLNIGRLAEMFPRELQFANMLSPLGERPFVDLNGNLSLAQRRHLFRKFGADTFLVFLKCCAVGPELLLGFVYRLKRLMKAAKTSFECSLIGD